MISAVSGEVAFADGLHFRPHETLCQEHIRDARWHTELPIAGWTQHLLGNHPSEHGSFDVEAVSDRDHHIQMVMVSHTHSFYETDTLHDTERRSFHEGVIAADLHGQHEFSWGDVFCRIDRTANKDWLVIVYKAGPSVPLQSAALLRHLYEHAPEPGEVLADRLPSDG